MTKSKIAHLWQRYQIKVTLVGAKPPVWRRLIIDSRTPLDALHHAIQISMGWTDSHMHQFWDMNKNSYGVIYDDDDFGFNEVNDESEYLISDLMNKEKQSISYMYDFGDDWNHKITLEKILPADNSVAPVQCIKGMRICPMEDSGGVWGYQRMVDIIKNPKDEEYEDIREWMGHDFNPDAKFDLKETQNYLDDFFKDVKFSTKKTNKAKAAVIEEDYDFDNLPDLLDSELDDFFSDPKVPEEFKETFQQMLASSELIEMMGDLLEESYQAFEEITKISKDKKIKKIAQNMLDMLEKDV